MIEIAFFVLLAIGAMVCMLDWRKGIYVVVLAGFLQDPFRKLFPGEPVAFTLTAGALFGCCLVGAVARGEQLGFRKINRWNPILAVPAILFIAWVGFQSVMTFVHTNSVILAGIGALAYLAPLPALLLGGCFTERRGEMEKLMRFYILVAAIFSLSVLLEAIGVHGKAFGSVGEEFFFYPERGGEVVLRAGLFRSPEIAGWHAAAAICMIVCLGVSKHGLRWFGLGQALLMTIFIAALILSGRRKFLVEIVMFIAFYGFILSYFRFGFRRLAMFLVVCGTLSGALFYYVSAREFSGLMDVYLTRGLAVQHEAVGRLEDMTVNQFEWVLRRNGLLGSGAGTGSQGAQHFGGGSDMVGFAAEGGFGKVLAELGVPGVLLLLALAVALARYLFSACQAVRGDPEVAALTYGLTAFLAANVLVFSTAHQIFGDVFVLLMLGLILSFLLNAPLLSRAAIPATEAPRRPALPLRRAEVQ